MRATETDVPWVAEQMIQAGACLTQENHACWRCEATGPGLFWLPSEHGVIEMAVWQCASCIAAEVGS